MNAFQEPMRKRPLSVSEYHLMGEVGIFAPGERVELIEGEIIDMPPIGSTHSGIVDHMTRLLVQAVCDKAIVRVQNPVVLSDLSEPEPDFALLKPRNNFYKDATPSARDVLLLIEVSDSTLRYDRDIKAPLYARHGIPETWIIDVANAQVTIHRDAGKQGYLNQFKPDDWQRVAPLQISDVTVDLSDLF